jgi:transcriptional regulator with XRE-family HTH domain
MRLKRDVDVFVGQQIVRFRGARNITVSDFATRLGITHAELEAIESGERRAHPKLLVAISKELAVPICAFFYSEDTEPADAPNEKRKLH